MSMEYQDCFTGEYSNCCDAQIYVTEICSACKEHCEPLKENQEQESNALRIQARLCCLNGILTGKEKSNE